MKKINKSKYLYAMFLLPLLYYIIFKYGPMFWLIIAFQDFSVSEGILGSPWVGVKHFEAFISDPYFWQLMRNTLLISIYNIIFYFPAPIILALFLNEVRNKTYKKAVQSISYLPHFLSTVVVCGMLVNYLSLEGAVNEIIASLGFEKINFLMEPGWFRTIYVTSEIWQKAGWGSIIFLAALTGIDEHLYEAAIVDGANRWQQLLHITLPGIMPTISIMLLINLGNIMNIGYEKILLLYNGATYETADVISTYVYRRGLMGADFSYGAAVGLFQSVISWILIVVSNKIAKAMGGTSLW